MTFYLHELPSLGALLFKLALLAYVARVPVHNSLTRLFAALLVLLSLLNLLEFSGINYHARQGFGETLNLFGYGYYALLFPTLALLLHISLRLSLDTESVPAWHNRYLFLYLPVIPLLYMLFATDLLVTGFVPFQYSMMRVAGDAYFLFETYAIVYLLAAVAYLIYGARAARPSQARARNRIWLLAIAPMSSMIAYLIVAQYLGLPKFTTTFYLPIAMTFFLVVTTYATYQYRLFDIEFYLPWSAHRARKTAFYDRIRATIAEIADLPSVSQLLERLAATLRCPVALMGGPRPVFAGAALSQLADFPREDLNKVDEIVVAAEIAELRPDMHALMRAHGVAAIVPFYPHSQNAASWLLLGGSFSDEVYTRRDFKMVERLFAKIGDLFLDKMITIRTQLAEAQRSARVLEQRLVRAEEDIAVLRTENQGLRQQTLALAQQHPIEEQLELGVAGKGLEERLREYETEIIERTLRSCGGNKSEAARRLGLRPNTLHYKLERFGLLGKNIKNH